MAVVIDRHTGTTRQTCRWHNTHKPTHRQNKKKSTLTDNTDTLTVKHIDTLSLRQLCLCLSQPIPLSFPRTHKHIIYVLNIFCKHNEHASKRERRQKNSAAVDWSRSQHPSCWVSPVQEDHALAPMDVALTCNLQWLHAVHADFCTDIAEHRP